MGPLLTRRLPLWKRAFDILGAGVGLMLCGPLLLTIAVVVKLDSPGPVFFAQMRRGRGGRPFRMYKFRSMTVDAETRKQDLLSLNEQDGPAFKVKCDPRVTAVGRWLRKTSLDELAQLLNILKGDMSLVGPRPLPCDESDACRLWHRRRLDATPGLTCTWQVRGRSRVTFAQWMRMDANYVRNFSFWGDLKLLLQTVPAVILGRNE
ncbi:MAG: sugar transferase [Pirellulales bacterium]|nr:sugar transferase [Pirellulales bacterium]